jgi:long-chain fatty acid transport protein
MDGITCGARSLLIFLILVPLLAATSLAGGPIHGSKAGGMGAAFVAVADDPSAILHNPAGLAAQKGTNVYSGGTALFGPSQYAAPFGKSESTEFQVFFPPHFYVSSDLRTENVVLGLGIYSPFGIGGRKWSESGLARYVSTESTISTVAVNPTVAWNVRPWLSVGFGVYYLHAFNTAKRMLNQSVFGAGDAESSLELDGGGVGYDLGILLFPGEKVSFGLAYRSQVKVDLNGTASLDSIAFPIQPIFGGSCFQTRVDSSLVFPQALGLGMAYRPSPSWTLALDFEWVGWSSFDRMDLDLAHEIPGAGISDTAIDFDYHDVLNVKLGVEFKATDSVAVRAGYAYVPAQVPERTLNPGNPDSNQHNFSIGLGYLWQSWVLDAFYLAEVYETRHVKNAILMGTYDSFVNMVGVSVGRHF